MPERRFYLWQVRSFTVRLALDFVETLVQSIEHQRRNQTEEHGGLLPGRIIDNDTVEVTDFAFIRSKHHRGASYDLGSGERYSVERHVKNFGKHSNPRPVGYFRTHLRPGLFLEQSDFALMTECFSDVPGIALAIRMDEAPGLTAGIFFWEDGDIDRSQAELIFLFDAAALRVPGPVEQQIAASTITENPWEWASELKKSSAYLLWGIAAGILFFATVSAFHRGRGPVPRIENISAETNASTRAPIGPPAQAQPLLRAVFNTPPAISKDAPGTSFQGANRTNSFSLAVRFPLDTSDPQTVALPTQAEPQDTHAETVRRTTVERPNPETGQSELRMFLLEQLKGVISLRDTPRGLVATVPDSAFDGSEPHAAVSEQLAHLVAVIRAHPGLRTEVEGNADNSPGEEMSRQRAEAIRRALIAEGLPDGSVTARRAPLRAELDGQSARGDRDFRRSDRGWNRTAATASALKR